MNLSYSDTYKTEQRRALAFLKVKPNEEAVTAVEAWALMSSLTHDYGLISFGWRKLAGAPAEAVRKASRWLRDNPEELWATYLTTFRKNYPAAPEKGWVSMEELMEEAS